MACLPYRRLEAGTLEGLRSSAYYYYLKTGLLRYCSCGSVLAIITATILAVGFVATFLPATIIATIWYPSASLP